jgi:uncharacterized membrane protein YheB (UPF0754 family)
MPDELIRAAVFIAAGALAGGLTNTIAIWMLFHPYEPPSIGKHSLKMLQGAIPKSQERLAVAIGKTVGTRLLTPEDLSATFSDESVRRAFDDHLSGFLDAVLHTERGSLRDLMPERMHEQTDEILQDVANFGLARLREYLDSDRCAEALTERAGEIVQSIADEPIAGILTPARESAISEAVEDWISGAVESQDFSTAIDDYLGRAVQKLLEPTRTFEEVLPLGLVGAVEKSIAAYLPMAIRRLGSTLENDEARESFKGFIHELLHRFLGDLKFHQRVVAKLIITESSVDKVLDTIEDEGVERLAEILQDPSMQDAMAQGINDAIVDFLRRPVTSVLGGEEDESVVDARVTVTKWIVGVAQDPDSRGFLVEKLEVALDGMGARTWGEVFEKLPPERLAEWLVSGARSDAAETLCREVVTRLASSLPDRPIGTPASWLPGGSVRKLEEAMSDPVWEWLQTQVPAVIEQIDIAGRVEQKILKFPPAKMEELVRKVTHKELRIIVRLGYVLGGLIGVALVFLDQVILPLLLG